jgi:actin-like protein 6A
VQPSLPLRSTSSASGSIVGSVAIDIARCDSLRSDILLTILLLAMFQVEGTVPSVVLDIGSHTVKAGLSGEDLPHALLPSVVTCATTTDGTKRDYRSGDPRDYGGVDLSNALTKRPRSNTDVVSPFDSNGLVEAWTPFEALVEHTLRDRLQVDTGEHAILYSEPNHNSRAARERLVELFFESFNAPAAYLAKSAVLAAYASGRTTGVVLDMGHSGVSAVPVLEGALVKDTFLRTSVGGAAVTAALKSQLASAGHQLRPLWSFRRISSSGGSGSDSGSAIDSILLPDVTKSYEQFAVFRILEEVKAGLCRVYDSHRGAELQAAATESEWELPDGHVIRMNAEKYEAAERALFGPLPHNETGLESESRLSHVQQVVRQEGVNAQFTSGTAHKCSSGVDGLVLNAVRMCEPSTHRDMYAGVCLTGGTSDMNGVYERISTGLAETYHKVRVLAATGSMERKYCSWTGGSILGTFSEFQRFWMSKKDYEESGGSFVHRRN